MNTNFPVWCLCFKSDNSTYKPAPKNNSDYIERGDYWKPILREKLEWDEEHDYNDDMNPGQRQNMLDQL